jgi:ankyrin repeat protein
MEAALNADAEMVQLLLARGADVNGRRPQGSPVLLRAVHDAEKVRLLLARRPRIEVKVLLLAASIVGSRQTLELLLKGGGDVNASVNGITALMLASFSGDQDVVRFLIERGAKVKARTPQGLTALTWGAVSGEANILRMLLDRGAEPNSRYEIPGGQVLTPVIAAVLQGRVDCLRLLVDRGADVNVQGGPFQRSALLCAATSGNEEIVGLLLSKGADVNAADWEGRTPLSWARRRGDSAIVQLLLKAGGRALDKDEREPLKEKGQSSASSAHIDPAAVSRAAAKSLSLLQQSAVNFTSKSGCISCHHQSLLAVTTSLARGRGFRVDEAIVAQERSRVLADLGAKREIVLGQELDPLLAPWTLWGLGTEGQKPTIVTDALVQYLVIHQAKDGSWRARVYRPPHDASHFTFTALAIRGLQLYAPKGRAAEIQARISRARDWLASTAAIETEDKSSRLLGLGWAGADPGSIQEATALLLREQRADGGWAQIPSLPSDAYATGSVLFALNQAGKIPVTHQAYQRGVSFLLRNQQEDGSWFVPTRAFPAVEFFSSGFPHGRSQYISEAATCWATIALALTAPGRDDYSAP